MLRDLVSLFDRPSLVNSRRKRRGNNLRSLLSIESLEERIALATDVTISAASGVFGLESVNFKYQKLATFVITTNDLSTLEFPSFSIDWDGNPATTGDILPAETVFTRIDTSPVLGETSTWEGIIFGEFNYAPSAAPVFADVIATNPFDMTIMDSEEVTINVLAQYSGSKTLSLAPPAGPLLEADVNTFTLNSTFGVDALSYSIDWGDEVETDIDTTTAITFLDHTYSDDSPFLLDEYKISIAVETVSGTFFIGGPNIQVSDVASNAVISGPTSIAANDIYTLDLSSSDVSAEDYPVVWMVYWDFQGDFDADPFEVVEGDLSSVTHVYTSDGPHTIVARLFSDDALTPAISNTINVTVGSQPTADAGGPYTTLADVPITLTGVGAGGTNLSYAWDLNDNDVYGEVGEVGAVVTFNPGGVAGPRTVRLKVTDEDTDVVSEADEATITVNATGALVVDDTLHVLGSGTGGDTVSVTVSGGNLVVNTGSGPQTFSISSVDDLNIRTGGGNDVINIAAAVTVPTIVDAGDGNDLIIGGNGRSVLMGGAGTDIVYGGAGDDVLLGGTGNDLVLGGGGNDAIVGGGGLDIMEGGNGLDLLIGGNGSDALLGGNGEDILIGGYTTNEGSIAALDAIMAIWTNGSLLNDRIAELTGSGDLLEAGVAVFDDNAIDVITGGAGADLIFGDRSLLGDGVIDLIALQSAQDRLIALN